MKQKFPPQFLSFDRMTKRPSESRPMTLKSYTRSIAGLSVIEVLVAMIVSVIVLTGLLQVFINSSNTYRQQMAVADVQENGQFAMQFLAGDIRNTDFWGCLRSLSSVANQLNSGGNPTYYGFAAGLSGTANASGGGPALAGTDTITVSGATNIGGGLVVQPPYGPSITSPISVGGGSSIVAGNILLVSDCNNGDIFQATAIAAGSISHAAAGSPGNTSASLSQVYNGGSYVYRPYTRLYDIRTGSSNGLPSLFMTSVTGSQELVEGVQGMIILYGVDTDADGTANAYVRANAVTNMSNVVSVRVSLLLETLSDNLTATGAPQAYTFNGTTVTPADRRVRRVYTTTISLRNRSIG